MLKNTSYLTFILIQLVVSGMVQFYFLGTGRFLQDRGVQGKYISGVMGIAQAVQAVATILLLGLLIDEAGFQWTLAIGALCWTVLFTTYVVSKQNVWIILFQAFHGLAYVFFMIGGQKFVGVMAPAEIGASAQSLIFMVTSGIGLFLGTQLAGYVMEKNSAAGHFQWQKIWAVPLGITLAGAIVLAVAFKVPSPADFQQTKPAPSQVAASGADR